ncbi:hypothetical protein [Streptomyces sp. NPDC020996]|uniref:hypothetical protein n=1 Tax=Streptomyces sp. NPDC020996 TaxID=3154791 RepID=UPI0033E091D5
MTGKQLTSAVAYVVYSALVMNVGERRLFHFTHVRNLRDILAETVTACIRAWNHRKERLFTETHVQTAWQRLSEAGLV